MKQKLNGGFYMLNSKKDLEALKNGDILNQVYKFLIGQILLLEI